MTKIRNEIYKAQKDRQEEVKYGGWLEGEGIKKDYTIPYILITTEELIKLTPVNDEMDL